MAVVLLFWDTNMADITSCELLATLETRRKLGRLSFGKDFWARYKERAGQLLPNFSMDPAKVLEGLSLQNST